MLTDSYTQVLVYFPSVDSADLSHRSSGQMPRFPSAKNPKVSYEKY